MNLPKVVLFDWDETIANTRNAVVFSVEQVLKKYNKENWVETKKKRDYNLSFKDNFLNFFCEDAEQAHIDYINFYKNFGFSKVSIKDGFFEFLEFLKNKNIILYIVSNKDTYLLKEEVRQNFKYNVFEEVVGDAGKPNSESVYCVLKKFDFEVNEKNVWFVGDSTQDYECAMASGVKPIIIGNNKHFDNIDVLRFENFEEFLREINKC